MSKNLYNFRFVITITLVSFLVIAFVIFLWTISRGRVLQVSDQVQVTAQVSNNCQLNLRTYPEKRIPPTGNWDTILRVEIYDPANGNKVMDYSGLVTNNNGEGTIDLCDENVALADKNYNFYLTGEAHLRKVFPNSLFTNNPGWLMDFTTGGRVLLAGDTSVIKDEKINSLDISTQIIKLYTGDGHNDLNKDSEVNSLDISNTIYNFYLIGD